jgi:leucyl aminopeptidase
VTVPKLALSENSEAALSKTRADVVVIGTLQGEDGLTLAAGSDAVNAAFDGKLADVLSTLGASGKAEETVKVPTLGKLSSGVVLAVGLGKAGADGVTAEQVRRASGAAARALSGTAHAVSTLSARAPSRTTAPRSRPRHSSPSP